MGRASNCVCVSKGKKMLITSSPQGTIPYINLIYIKYVNYIQRACLSNDQTASTRYYSRINDDDGSKE